MKRIENLRKIALEHKISLDEFFYKFYKAYGKSTTVSYPDYADAYYTAFSTLTPDIADGEIIVGRPVDTLSAEEKEELAAMRPYMLTDGGGQASHMTVDFELLLSVGINGIIDKINGYLADCDAEKIPFYEACKKCLLAVIKHSEGYSALAAKKAEAEQDPERRAELLEISRVCKKVPAEPAESFHEAVQSVHFVNYSLNLDPIRFYHQQFQLGRPDRYLYRFYKADIENGRITPERAQLLLDLIAIQLNMYVPSGLSSGFMVGGKDKNGNTVANELTEMCMQIIDDIRLVYPAVGLCYTDDMPKKYLDKACEILSHGRSHPAIFNDRVITEGLRSLGVSEDECHDYVQSTCVEITPIAASNVWVASPYTNMPALLLETMDREYPSLEAHIDALLSLLDERIKRNFENENRTRMIRAEKAIYPLLSCLVNDCLKRGVDIEKGGARYNWIMPSFVGMANLVDSVYSLKVLVYDEKRLTVKEFKSILESNFEGNEALRARILEQIPKYGNDNDEVDGYFKRFVDHLVAECKKYKGNLVPSVFCWVMHERFGRETGATPDGRLASFPLGDGSGPCQGREKCGPTASIISSTKWDHTNLIGGVAVNMKFSKSTLGERSLSVMRSLVEAFMARGGFEIQINVTSREILEAAVANPELYRDLIVRIGGYSDYFTRLSREMQSELLLRTEHQI